MNKEDILKILEMAKDKNGEVPMRLVRQAFEKLPESCEDAVSRQGAIDTLNVGAELLRRVLDADIVGVVERAKYEWGLELIESYISDMKELPSVQPEIIHCKECKYGVQDEDERWYCEGFGCQVGEEDGSGFCADAERRTDEKNT